MFSQTARDNVEHGDENDGLPRLRIPMRVSRLRTLTWICQSGESGDEDCYINEGHSYPRVSMFFGSGILERLTIQ